MGVGVGNIYAAEALFLAGLHPKRSVARIGEARWNALGASSLDGIFMFIRFIADGWTGDGRGLAGALPLAQPDG